MPVLCVLILILILSKKKRLFREMRILNDFGKECIYQSIAFTVHLRSAMSSKWSCSLANTFSFTKQIICYIRGCWNSDFCSKLERLFLYGLLNTILYMFENANWRGRGWKYPFGIFKWSATIHFFIQNYS